MKKSTVLDFRPQVTNHQINRLNTLAGDMEIGDELTIVLERKDAHQADQIWNVLKKQGFELQPHGGHNLEYYLRAKKKK